MLVRECACLKESPLRRQRLEWRSWRGVRAIWQLTCVRQDCWCETSTDHGLGSATTSSAQTTSEFGAQTQQRASPTPQLDLSAQAIPALRARWRTRATKSQAGPRAGTSRATQRVFRDVERDLRAGEHESGSVKRGAFGDGPGESERGVVLAADGKAALRGEEEARGREVGGRRDLDGDDRRRDPSCDDLRSGVCESRSIHR
eukprot:1603950-Rhodomonas_salina.1